MESIVESDKMAFKGYEIIINEDQKYGIKDSKGTLIIDCVFDDIEWLPSDNLVKFRIKNKYALCVIYDIEMI